MLRVSDRDALGEMAANEEAAVCELADMDAMLKLTQDVDVIVHFGGQSNEGSWENVLNSNIVGFYNLYEGARKNGVKRVIWASSVHAVGFHPTTTTIDCNVRTRPDSNYGVSKAFGENVAQYYWDQYGIESVSVRIYSCFPEPANLRMLATWLSYRDLGHLIDRAILTPHVGHTIVYGVSNNTGAYVNNGEASHLGYYPQDNGEDYRAKVEAKGDLPNATDNLVAVHGGQFADYPHFDD